MFGQLTEITREKELIHITAHEKWSVVHFFHRDFKRCKIMDKHLEVSLIFETVSGRAENLVS